MIQALLSDPPVADDILIQSVHQLCSSLLMVSLSNAPQLGFAFELALCIYSHRLLFNASQVSQLFAGMQSCFRLILAHILRLESQGKKMYTDPPSSPPSFQGNAAPGSSLAKEGQVPEENWNSDIISDYTEWPDIGLDDEIEVPGDDSVLETSRKQSHLDPNSLLRSGAPPILIIYSTEFLC